MPAFSFCSEKLVIIVCLSKLTSVNHSPALLKKKKNWKGSGLYDERLPHKWVRTCSFLQSIVGFGRAKRLCAAYTPAKNHDTENSKQIFPEKELHGHSPNFRIHVSVSDLCIPTIDLPILLQGNRCGPILGIYRSLTDTWMWKLGLRPRNSRKMFTLFTLYIIASRRRQWHKSRLWKKFANQ